jgi:hypothetical protein
MSVSIMAMNGQYAREDCAICSKICDSCATECNMFDEEHCKACAQECQNCADECRKMAAM